MDLRFRFLDILYEALCEVQETLFGDEKDLPVYQLKGNLSFPVQDDGDCNPNPNLIVREAQRDIFKIIYTSLVEMKKTSAFIVGPTGTGKVHADNVLTFVYTADLLFNVELVQHVLPYQTRSRW